ncbi:hypothetical protein HK100_012444 [Physocladia obscura]|uniref:BZIP domain-containing protein n=1 Tax=Physocladia obscura TaxID=109957 RepID=A0AAD5XD72_9FUNG|nr:hypothetical protein HK100_012444 [Physocladia obscura]
MFRVISSSDARIIGGGIAGPAIMQNNLGAMTLIVDNHHGQLQQQQHHFHTTTPLPHQQSAPVVVHHHEQQQYNRYHHQQLQPQQPQQQLNQHSSYNQDHSTPINHSHNNNGLSRDDQQLPTHQQQSADHQQVGDRNTAHHHPYAHAHTLAHTPTHANQYTDMKTGSVPYNHSGGIYNPDNKRGRKKTLASAPSHKAALNREAQRALRERKANLIKDLDAQIADLDAANAFYKQTLAAAVGGSVAKELEDLRRANVDLRQQLQQQTVNSAILPPPAASHDCLHCSSERIKTIICIDQIKVLEAQIQALTAPPAHPNPTPSVTPSPYQPPLPPSLPLPSSSAAAAASVAQAQAHASQAQVQVQVQDFIFDFNSLLANQEVLLDFMDTNIVDWNSPPASLSLAGSVFIPPSAATVAKTSEQLYGPMEVDSFKIILKHSTSLRHHPELVDGLFDLLLAQTRVTNVRDARRILVKINRACFRLLEKIDRVEQSKYNEIHFNDLCAPPEEIKQQFAARPVGKLPPHVERFRDTLRSIPSFHDYYAVIDQFCCFWVHKEDIRGEAFYMYNYLLYMHEILCRNVEDRAKFWEAYDRVWASDHKSVGDLLDKVECVY